METREQYLKRLGVTEEEYEASILEMIEDWDDDTINP